MDKYNGKNLLVLIDLARWCSLENNLMMCQEEKDFLRKG